MPAGLIDRSGWINISTSIDQADACFPALGKGVHVFLPTFPPGNVCMISRAWYRSHVFPFSTLVHTSAPSSDWFIWLFAFAVIDGTLVASLSKLVGISDVIEICVTYFNDKTI